jgi:adenosylcobinamide-phosphate synthase
MTVEWWMWLLPLPAAFGLDLLLGDPEWFPHPVRLIGAAATLLEPPLRAICGSTRFAGAVLVVLIVAGTGAAATAAVVAAFLYEPWAGLAMETALIYFSIAPRCLSSEVKAVLRPLESGNLPAARKQLSRIVGRDTELLDDAGVVRAAVEAAAESTGDGVISPLFFAGLSGGIGAIVYRAINTLDSMVGHMEEPYTYFGRPAARLDDAANFVPTRIGVWLMVPTAAGLAGADALAADRIARRDGGNHPSPNAGLWEAAFAGALGVRLGGPVAYDGRRVFRAPMGDSMNAPTSAIARRGIRLMWATAALGLLFAVGLRAAVCYCSINPIELPALR